MNPSSNFAPAERIQSLGAGVLSGISLGTIAIVLGAINSAILGESVILDVYLIIKGAIAIISGFLFGVTYRYTVGSHNNPQLKLGVVFAFGLVRGLAIGEMAVKQGDPLPQIALWVGENLVLFAVTAIILDLAIGRGWVKSFSSEGEPSDS